MNGKSIKKRLMRNRRNVFWGARVYLTVRIPLASLGLTAPKPVEIDGLSASDVDGYWTSADDSTSVHISRVFSGGNPLDRPRKLWETVYCLEPANHGGFEWWEGFTSRRADGDVIREPLPDDVVRQHRDYVRWFESLDDIDHPIVDALMGVTLHCKTYYWDVRGDYLLLTYSVKWFYPSRRFAFSAALSRAMKVAKRAGVDVRVVT